jgi:hypothetical protein
MIIIIASIAAWLIGAGIRSELRDDNSWYRWELLSDAPNPLINLAWPLEVVFVVFVRVSIVMPIAAGQRLIQSGRAMRARKQLAAGRTVIPEARIVRSRP